MHLKQVMVLRKLFGRIGALICLLFFIALLDGCVARFREPMFTVHLLPGWSDAAEGQLQAGIREPEQLRITGSSPYVALKIDMIKSGYFLGGNMWIGTISAARDVSPGSYDMQVFVVGDASGDPVSAYRAIVYRDYSALRQSFLSIIQRTFDIAPWIIALGCIPALGLVLGAVYLVSSRIETLLATQGRAEIYKIGILPEGSEISFGLGERHGVREGMRLQVSDASGVPVCFGHVRSVAATDATALVEGDHTLATGYVVSIAADDHPDSRGE